MAMTGLFSALAFLLPLPFWAAGVLAGWFSLPASGSPAAASVAAPLASPAPLPSLRSWQLRETPRALGNGVSARRAHERTGAAEGVAGLQVTAAQLQRGRRASPGALEQLEQGLHPAAPLCAACTAATA